VKILKEEFPDLKVNHLPIRKGDVKESQNSPELLRSLFPKVEPYSFQDALRETIEWLRKDGASVANGPSVSD
jgi:UDP-glucose 4-epimerase